MVEMSWAKASWLVYFFLLIFRIIVGPFLLGYIHPDEFFQGGQELFFGCPPTIPWEFEPENAIRSVFPPALMTLLPLRIYRGLLATIEMAGGRHEMIARTRGFSGIEVLVVPRITCALISVLVVDWSVWSICRTRHEQNEKMRDRGVPIPVLLLGSAWPTIAMLTRPFSNSMETFIFASLMASVLTTKANDKSSFNVFFCWKIGIICALGIFTRFTFVFFAIPILLLLLSKMIRDFGVKKSILFKKLGWMAISFISLSFGIIQADTAFYFSRRDEDTRHSSHDQGAIPLFDYSSLVVTPLNALAYNSKISNLRDHGLHPRWTHAVVNMLIMFGPLTLATYFLAAKTLFSKAGRTLTSNYLSWKTFVQGDISMASAAAIVFGLGFLSVAPHQEPRFLLPLLVPLVLLGEKPIRLFPASGICIWIFFNLILVALFGVLHQGGVTKSLLAVASTTSWGNEKKPTPWIYMRTYMPPTFLTRSQHDATGDSKTCSNFNGEGVCDQFSFDNFGTTLDDACQEEKFRVMDLKSSSVQKLQETIQKELSCSTQLRGSVSNTFLYLVIPFMKQNEEDNESSFTLSFTGDKGEFQLSNEKYEWNHVSSHGPHLTTEDFPPFGGSFSDFYNMLVLNVYNISCAEMI